MVIKFHMQHDQTAGLQNDKIQSGQESKMATATENNKINKLAFSPEQIQIHYLAEILFGISQRPRFSDLSILKDM